MGISPEQWNRVKDLYESALECDPLQRDVFLRRNAGDEAVLREAMRLLSEHDVYGTATVDTCDFYAEKLSKRLVPGKILAGRFRIVRFIAAGGMGEVYEAEDLVLEENLAIKTIRPRILQQENAIERLKQEVHLARKVTHPNVCRVFDLFWHKTPKDDPESALAFVSMELLQGETLSERLSREGRFAAHDPLPLIHQIIEGLEAAHRAGVVHRDLKPANIMLVPGAEQNDIRAVITDFGLAFHAGVDPTKTSGLASTKGIIGTPAYMAPEQIEGKEVTKLADIYSLGLIIYEMVTGKHAFAADTPVASITNRLTLPPESPKHLAPELSDVWEQTILRCLERDPNARCSSAAEVAKRLLSDTVVAGLETQVDTGTASLWQFCRRRTIAIPLLIFLSALITLAGWWLHRNAGQRWARNYALPQIAEFIGENKVADAYDLAVQAEHYIPDDPMLTKTWDEISWTASIITNPPGVSVFQRKYGSTESAWKFVGRTPIPKQRLPQADIAWKFELNGFTTVERASLDAIPVLVTMDKEGTAPPGMIRVELPPSETGGDLPVELAGMPGYQDMPAIPLGTFWIDKFEVTNRQFKQFVEQGGYQQQRYWKYAFDKNGRTLSWSKAMTLFRDKTGRPGPATWVEGDYPKGEDDFPVTGVSWYEAAAYAEYMGKALPTIYHWNAAAMPDDAPDVLPLSNFDRKGPARVGSYRGMSWSGAYDMAGNVKEWALNETSSGERYILGGAWDEPSYSFNDVDYRSPFERAENFGFRCARYSLSGSASKSADRITWQARDYSREKPVSDETFRIYKEFYSYDKAPLEAIVESTQQTSEWKLQVVSFAAAYGKERVKAYLFLPVNASPPFQTVVYYPGADAVRMRTTPDPAVVFDHCQCDFIVRSGRAVMFPIYKATFERNDGLKSSYPNTTSSYRDHVIQWSKDLGRSIDYLETRSDIDHNKVAYEGYSWGAAMGALMPAVESRIKLVLLLAPGFFLQKALPEVDQINFAPRVKVPTLMLNGRLDSVYPPETSQVPMFRLLGAPASQKRRVVYDTGHNIPPNEVIKEMLTWLDRYFGPTK